MIHVLYCENTNVLELDDLQNEVDGSFIDDATVTLTLEDEDGDEVAGETWPLAMTYVTDSAGLYRAYLIDSLPLVANARYTAIVTALVSGSLQGKWRLECLAKTRR